MGIRHLFALLTILFIYSANSHAIDEENSVSSLSKDPKCERILDGIPEDLTQLDSSYHIVLDANTIVNDPKCIFNFGKAQVVIPVTTFNELDYIKDNAEDPAANFAVRKFFSYYKDLLIKSGGAPVLTLESGGTIRIDRETRSKVVADEWRSESNDIKIIEVARALHDKNKGKVLFVTSDNPAFIRAVHSGIPVVEYSSPYSKPYTGMMDYNVSPRQLMEFVKSAQLELPVEMPATDNQFVVLKDSTQLDKPVNENDLSNIGRVVVIRDEDGKPETKILKPLLNFKNMNSPVMPKNIEQAMALDLLFDKDIDLVTLTGVAGTGKTLLAIAASLYQTLPNWNGEKVPDYDELLISRHIVTMGKDIGALPGDGNEKVSPFLQPYFDNMQFLAQHLTEKKWRPQGRGTVVPATSTPETYQAINSPTEQSPVIQFPPNYEVRSKKERDKFIKQYQRDHGVNIREASENYLRLKNRDQKLQQSREHNSKPITPEMLNDERHVSIEVLSFIRGRSLVGKILIVDEAQNLTSHEIQSIITRAGPGTKIILIGDVGQIDAKLNHRNNGLSIAVNLFRDQAITGHVSLTKGERSRLADLANRLYIKFNGLDN